MTLGKKIGAGVVSVLAVAAVGLAAVQAAMTAQNQNQTSPPLVDMSPRGYINLLKDAKGAAFDHMYLQLMMVMHATMKQMDELASTQAQQQELKDYANQQLNTHEQDVNRLMQFQQQFYGSGGNTNSSMIPNQNMNQMMDQMMDQR